MKMNENKKEHFGDIAKSVSSLFFPNRCIFCDTLIDPFEHYCEDCIRNIPFIKGEICRNCGEELLDCSCMGEPNYYTEVAATMYYDEAVRKCVHRFKFKGERNIYKPLSELMIKTFYKRYSDKHIDYVTYVPMHPKRERERGFNQSFLLAKEIAQAIEIPFAENMLIKVLNTNSQHECSAFERTGNLIGAFDVSDKYDIVGKNILLVDDIKTTGATLNECGKMFCLYDVNSVFCLTAALRKSKMDSLDYYGEANHARNKNRI